MEFRIDHNLVDVPLVPATDHLPTYNTRKGNEITLPHERAVTLPNVECPPPDLMTAESRDVLKKSISAHDLLLHLNVKRLEPWKLILLIKLKSTTAGFEPARPKPPDSKSNALVH